MEDPNIPSPRKLQRDGNSDSVDIILADFAAQLHKLKRNHAYASIHILADYFISIARCFTITTSEYEYFLDKYQGSLITEADLSQTEIVIYLKTLIERLEGVTGTTFDSSALHLSSEKPLAVSNQDDLPPQTEVEEVQRLKKELADYPELSEILDETITSPAIVSIPQKITPPSEGDPDLVNILEQLPPSSPTTQSDIHKETILRAVESLESFSFGEKVPLFKVFNDPHNDTHSKKK